MQLTLLTPHRKIVENISVDEVIAPGFLGLLDMLEGHANFVSPLETGILKWKHADKWTSAVISHGVMEVQQGTISIMAGVSEMSSEIDVLRAKKAGEIAKQKIEEGGLDEGDFQKYELKLKRSMARLSVSGEE